MTERVRWDRISRVALLLVLLVVLGLYVSPAKTYLDTWREARTRQAEVDRLERQHRRLVERRRELGRPEALEREARRLGMVKPGERGYVVRGLPRD